VHPPPSLHKFVRDGFGKKGIGKQNNQKNPQESKALPERGSADF